MSTCVAFLTFCVLEQQYTQSAFAFSCFGRHGICRESGMSETIGGRGKRADVILRANVNLELCENVGRPSVVPSAVRVINVA